MNGAAPSVREDETSLLRARLQEAEETLRAIRSGEVDAIVVEGKNGCAVYTLKSAAEPYRILVEQMSEGALTLSPDGIVLYCNEAFARILGYRREDLIGHYLSKFIVGATAKQATNILDMIASKFTVQFITKGGSLADTHVSSAPLVLDDDLVHCLIVTDLTRQWLRVMHDAIVVASADAIFSLNLQGAIETWNPAAERLFGHRAEEAIGRHVAMLDPSESPAAMESLLQGAAEGALTHQEMTLKTKDDTTIDALISAAPLKVGPIIGGVAMIAKDISERKRHEEHVRLLMRELNHRAKNLLSVVQGVASQTARNSPPQEFVARLTARIGSLSASQNLLLRNEWKGADVCDLVKYQLSGFIDSLESRVVLSGPNLMLKPAATQAIGMALHELATNAIKYGALSCDNGKVSVEWGLAAQSPSEFWMKWTESGGPDVTPPTSKGFGYNVMVKMIEIATHGRANLLYRTEGLCWELKAPVTNISEL